MRLLLLIMVPPLVGALIGFVTNVIAIKMLFRPLKEYRVFGVRLPFTPGILPRQRHKLADSIGSMVERELLTPELLRQRLSQDDVREKLRESVSRFTGKLLERPLDSFAEREADAETDSLIRALKDTLFSSPALETVTRAIALKICAEAEKRYPDARSALINFIRRNDIRKTFEIQGQRLITEILLSLNVFQRVLISAGQYEQTIREQMPEIIAKLIDRIEELLESDNVRAKVLDFFNGVIARNVSASKIPGDLFASIKESVLSGHRGQTLAELLAIDSERKSRLDGFLCSRLLGMASDEIEDLLGSINVRLMVSQRIDELDMIRVERIILDIMANQLKWINIFGAILGFLIGLFQVLINAIIR